MSHTHHRFRALLPLAALMSAWAGRDSCLVAMIDDRPPVVTDRGTCTTSHSANVFSNAIHAHGLGCAFRFFLCTGLGGMAPLYCKVALMAKLARQKQWSWVVFLDADVKMTTPSSDGDFELAALLEAITSKPLSTRLFVNQLSIDGSTVLRERHGLTGASVITLPTLSCGCFGSLAGVSSCDCGYAGLVNLHCTAVMLWRLGGVAEEVADEWVRSVARIQAGGNHCFDQINFNLISRQLRSGAVVALSSSVLMGTASDKSDGCNGTASVNDHIIRQDGSALLELRGWSPPAPSHRPVAPLFSHNRVKSIHIAVPCNRSWLCMSMRGRRAADFSSSSSHSGPITDCIEELHVQTVFNQTLGVSYDQAWKVNPVVCEVCRRTRGWG